MTEVATSITDFLGETSLVKNDGTEVNPSELSTEKGGVIGFFFSAKWGEPSQEFTPMLITAYNEIKASGKDFEIIFVSWDNDEKKQFKPYFDTQPWLAIPHDKSKELGEKCQEKYKVGGIPTLVLVEADTGNVIKKNARIPVTRFGGLGFPYTEESCEEARLKILASKEEVLNGLDGLKFLDQLVALDEPDTKFDFNEVVRTSESLAIAFLEGKPRPPKWWKSPRLECANTSRLAPKLKEIKHRLGPEKFSLIVVPHFELEEDEFAEVTLKELKGTPMIPTGEPAKEVAEKLKPILGEITAPQVFVIDAREESAMKILSENAAHSMYYKRERAYPWTDAALDALVAQEKNLVEFIKEKQPNLEFLAPNNLCHIIDKEGVHVPLATLQSKGVVALLFSWYYYPWCLEFEAKLIEVYNDCKEKDIPFEVILVAIDDEVGDWTKHYDPLPWCTLEFADQTMKKGLVDAFNIEDLPVLLLFKGDGTLITRGGKPNVTDVGSEFFPWDDEITENGRRILKERYAESLRVAAEALEKSYIDQEAAGKLVIRRHRGLSISLEIGVDHVLQFKGFATAAVPLAKVRGGLRVYFEITFLEGTGSSSVGWALDGFKPCEGESKEGVGFDQQSFGYDGQNRVKTGGRINETREFGLQFDLDKGHVVTLALDLKNRKDGRVVYLLDGEYWKVGVSHILSDCTLGFYPAFTGTDMKIAVNFGYSEFKFPPPVRGPASDGISLVDAMNLPPEKE